MRFETFLAGNEYVGPEAADDSEWISELFDRLVTEWRRSHPEIATKLQHEGKFPERDLKLLLTAMKRLDGAPLGTEDVDVDPARLDGQVLQVGKRQFRRLRLG